MASNWVFETDRQKELSRAGTELLKRHGLQWDGRRYDPRRAASEAAVRRRTILTPTGGKAN